MRHRFWTGLLSLGVFIALSSGSGAYATVHYVKVEGTGNGTSWADAYGDLVANGGEPQDH